LTPIQGACWQIKNAISFPSAPKGTSEALIYTALKDLHTEEEEALRKGGRVPHPVNNNLNGAEITSAINVPQSSLVTSPSSSSLSSVSTEEPGSTPSSSVSNSDVYSSESSSDGQSNGEANDTTLPSSGKKPSSAPSTCYRRDANRVAVTFGISAAPQLEPVHNLGGWKVSALSKTYGKVVKGAKLVQRGEFRVCACHLTFVILFSDPFHNRASSTRRMNRCMYATLMMASDWMESTRC